MPSNEKTRVQRELRDQLRDQLLELYKAAVKFSNDKEGKDKDKAKVRGRYC